MSYAPTLQRPFARMGWGGKAASHFRGALKAGWRGKVGTVVYRSPGVQANCLVTGITRDSAGAVLTGCVVDLFLTGGDVLLASITSDGAGAFSFHNPGSGPFYIVAYKAGSPDVAGTTANTVLAPPAP